MLNFPFKIFENPNLPPDEKLEYYRGRGGYLNRWIIRKERIVKLPPKIYVIDPKYLFGFGNKFIVTRPEIAAIIRNFIP